MCSSSIATEVGQKVRVCRLRDRVSPAIAKKLGQVDTVQGFKLVDASGVGLIDQFDDQSTTWFFENELEPVH